MKQENHVFRLSVWLFGVCANGNRFLKISFKETLTYKQMQEKNHRLSLEKRR